MMVYMYTMAIKSNYNLENGYVTSVTIGQGETE